MSSKPVCGTCGSEDPKVRKMTDFAGGPDFPCDDRAFHDRPAQERDHTMDHERCCDEPVQPSEVERARIKFKAHIDWDHACYLEYCKDVRALIAAERADAVKEKQAEVDAMKRAIAKGSICFCPWCGDCINSLTEFITEADQEAARKEAADGK